MCTGTITYYTCSLAPQHTGTKYHTKCATYDTDPTACLKNLEQVHQSGNCTKCMTPSEVAANHAATEKAAKPIFNAMQKEFGGLYGLDDTLLAILEESYVRKRGLESLGWTFEGKVEGLEEM